MLAAGQSAVQAAGFTQGKGLMRTDERTAQTQSEMTFWPAEHRKAGGKAQRTRLLLFSVLPEDELCAETSPLISFPRLSRAVMPQQGFI